MFFFFFNDTATTEIYTLSLHDALPIFPDASRQAAVHSLPGDRLCVPEEAARGAIVGKIDGPDDAGRSLADWPATRAAHVRGNPSWAHGVDQDSVAA